MDARTPSFELYINNKKINDYTTNRLTTIYVEDGQQLVILIQNISPVAADKLTVAIYSNQTTNFLSGRSWKASEANSPIGSTNSIKFNRWVWQANELIAGYSPYTIDPLHINLKNLYPKASSIDSGSYSQNTMGMTGIDIEIYSSLSESKIYQASIEFSFPTYQR